MRAINGCWTWDSNLPISGLSLCSGLGSLACLRAAVSHLLLCWHGWMLPSCQLSGACSWPLHQGSPWAVLPQPADANGNLLLVGTQRWAQRRFSSSCSYCCLLLFSSVMPRVNLYCPLTRIICKTPGWIYVCISLITARFKLCSGLKGHFESLAKKGCSVFITYNACIHSLTFCLRPHR